MATKKMKVNVLKTFYDVRTKKKNRQGDVLEITEKRFAEIQENTAKLIKLGKLEEGAVLVETVETTKPETVPATEKKATKKRK